MSDDFALLRRGDAHLSKWNMAHKTLHLPISVAFRFSGVHVKAWHNIDDQNWQKNSSERSKYVWRWWYSMFHRLRLGGQWSYDHTTGIRKTLQGWCSTGRLPRKPSYVCSHFNQHKCLEASKVNGRSLTGTRSEKGKENLRGPSMSCRNTTERKPKEVNSSNQHMKTATSVHPIIFWACMRRSKLHLVRSSSNWLYSVEAFQDKATCSYGPRRKKRNFLSKPPFNPSDQLLRKVSEQYLLSRWRPLGMQAVYDLESSSVYCLCEVSGEICI